MKVFSQTELLYKRDIILLFVSVNIKYKWVKLFTYNKRIRFNVDFIQILVIKLQIKGQVDYDVLEENVS